MSAGAVIDGMIKSFQSNRNQFKNKRKPFNSEELEKRGKNYDKALKYKEVSKTEMDQIKARIREKARKEKLRALLIIGLTAMLITAFAWLLLS